MWSFIPVVIFSCVGALMAAHKSGSSGSRNELTLKERVDVIDYQKKNPLTNSRNMAEVFHCERTQIQQILKNRESILEEFEGNAPLQWKNHRGTQFEEVNEAMYTWYTLARQRNVPLVDLCLKRKL